MERRHESPVDLVFVVEQDSKGAYNARAVGEKITITAKNHDALVAGVREAVQSYYRDSDEPRPEKVLLHHVHDEVITL